jgi:hypothetical protein
LNVIGNVWAEDSAAGEKRRPKAAAAARNECLVFIIFIVGAHDVRLNLRQGDVFFNG